MPPGGFGHPWAPTHVQGLAQVGDTALGGGGGSRLGREAWGGCPSLRMAEVWTWRGGGMMAGGVRKESLNVHPKGGGLDPEGRVVQSQER